MLDSFLFKRRARHDAGRGVDSAQDHITEALGIRPTIDPRASTEDARAVETLGREPERQELVDDLRRIDDHLGDHYPLVLLYVGLTVLFFIEFGGSSLAIGAFGITGFHRQAFALGLAVASFMGTRSLAHDQAIEAPGWRRAVKRIVVVIVVLIAFLATAWARVAAISEEGSLVEAILLQAVMTTATLGPALVAHGVLLSVRQQRPLLRERARKRSELRELEREIRAARQHITATERRGRDFDARAARLRAGYSATQRFERAEH